MSNEGKDVFEAPGKIKFSKKVLVHMHKRDQGISKYLEWTDKLKRDEELVATWDGRLLGKGTGARVKKTGRASDLTLERWANLLNIWVEDVPGTTLGEFGKAVIENNADRMDEKAIRKLLPKDNDSNEIALPYTFQRITKHAMRDTYKNIRGRYRGYTIMPFTKATDIKAFRCVMEIYGFSKRNSRALDVRLRSIPKKHIKAEVSDGWDFHGTISICHKYLFFVIESRMSHPEIVFLIAPIPEHDVKEMRGVISGGRYNSAAKFLLTKEHIDPVSEVSKANKESKEPKTILDALEPMEVKEFEAEYPGIYAIIRNEMPAGKMLSGAL